MLLVRIIPKPFLTKMFLLSSGSNMLKEKENTFFGEKSTIQTKSQVHWWMGDHFRAFISMLLRGVIDP